MGCIPTLSSIALFTLGCASAQQSPPPTPQSDVPQAVLDRFPAVVRIYAVMESPRGGRIERQRGAGSGAIISPDGYVVTNHHVAGNTTHLICNLADHQEVPATLVGTDALADIAVLKIDTSKLRDPEQELPVAPWGDSDGVRVGDAVFAMGSPAAISQSVTKGIIANDKMIMPKMGANAFRLDGEDNGALVRWLAHDAVIFGGNSGGPLMNARGEIVGINEIGFANLSGAIPGNLARTVAAQLIQHGRVPRAWSGITLQSRLGDEPRGALVAAVAPDSPAERAGLRVGDLLLSVGSAETDCRIDEDLPLINGRLLALPVKEALEARFVREGRDCATPIELVEREPAQRPSQEARRLGCTYSTLTRAGRRRLDLGDVRGVLIGGVRAGGPAAAATPALQADDVIVALGADRIVDAESFQRGLDAVTGERAVFTVRRGSEELLLAVELAEASKRRPPARARRAWLPIKTQALTPELREALGVEAEGAVRVTAVLPSAGDAFALQVGDIVTSFAGKPIKIRRAGDASAFRRMVERQRIGDDVEVLLHRAGRSQTVAVTMLAPPPSEARLDSHEQVELGFTCRDRQLADAGVDIVEVERGGWADLAGLAKGDRLLRFDNVAVTTSEQLADTAAKAVDGRSNKIVVLVERRHTTRFLALEPVWR